LIKPVNSLKIQWKHLTISFNETSEFTQNLIKVLDDLVQWDQWIHSKSNESTRQTEDTFLVMILKLLKTFWEKFVMFYHLRFLQVKKWRLLFSHPSISLSIHPSIQMAVHNWLISLMSFLNYQLCNNMILPWKAEIISVLIAGLDLDVSGSKYAPLFILHLYFNFAGRNSYDTYYSLVHTEHIWTR
jgi:hypothetical protein